MAETARVLRKKRQLESDSAASGSDQDYAPLSTSESEKGEDSDEDPSWRPGGGGVPAALGYGSDEEEGKRKKPRAWAPKRARGRPAPAKAKTTPAPKPKATPKPVKTVTKTVSTPKNQVVTPVTGYYSPPDLPSKPISGAFDAPEVSDDDDEQHAHNFEKGDYVIEKKDLKNYQRFPIWKIDAGKLLQKYEPVVQDGKLRHRSMSTYSSWSQVFQKNYKAVLVDIIIMSSPRNMEMVQVKDEYMPHPPDVKVEEDNPVLQAFNVYVQILTSQALEPGFLAALQEEKDEYYSEPLEKVDKLLAEKSERASNTMHWTEEFKTSLETFPYVNICDRFNLLNMCEATLGVERATKAVGFTGKPYNTETLEEMDIQPLPRTEFEVGPLAAKRIELYHSLHHFKYNAYRKCLCKVQEVKQKCESSEISVVLDQCLQDRAWVKQIFHEFDTLLERIAKEEPVKSAKPEPPEPPANGHETEKTSAS